MNWMVKIKENNGDFIIVKDKYNEELEEKKEVKEEEKEKEEAQSRFGIFDREANHFPVFLYSSNLPCFTNSFRDPDHKIEYMGIVNQITESIPVYAIMSLQSINNMEIQT